MNTQTKRTGQAAIEFLPNGGEIENAAFDSLNNVAGQAAVKVLKQERADSGDAYHGKKRIYLDGTPCFEGAGTVGEFHFWGDEPYDGYNGAALAAMPVSRRDDRAALAAEAAFEECGEFAFLQPPTITLTAAEGKKIKHVVLWFDETYGEYAARVSYTANGKTIETDNHRLSMVLNLDEAAQNVTIRFLSWSAQNRCAKLRRIHTNYSRVFEGDRIVSFEASAEDRPDPAKLEYGLSAQYGSLELIDVDSDFEILNEYELLQDNQPIVVSMAWNTADGKTERVEIGSYLSEGWELKPNDNTIKVNLTDAVTRLQNVKLDTYTLGKMDALLKKKPERVTALTVIKKILEIAGFGYGVAEGAPNDTAKPLPIVLSAKVAVEKDTAYDMVKKLLADCKCRLYLHGDTAYVVEV